MQTHPDDINTVLLEWRTKILNGFLMIVSIAAGVMTVISIVYALSHPAHWPAVIVFLVMEVILIALAVFRRIDYRIRAWGVLLVPYAVGVTVLASTGLGSSGRLYLLAVPIGALILLGTRPGMFMAVVSGLTMIAFAILADRGVLANWLVSDRNSLLLSDWLAEFADTLGLLGIVMVLLIMFYRFQERLIASERRAQAELLDAHALLEQQNATLEQKVLERTSELQTTNHSLEQRNAALGILNSVSEAMTKTLDVKTVMRLVGDRIREIFDVDSSMIMLLDRQNNMIHVPYEYDRNEGGYIDYVEPFPLGTGLSSKVISTGQPLIANTLEEEIANGAYFPPEIIAQGQGSYGQSWLGVPIMASDQVLGLIALADNRAHVFNQNHMRLLQTLSSNLGAAVENARLFAETEQRNRELTIINRVQAALASNLDMEAIYELIGEKVQEVFHVDVVDIVAYDPGSNVISMPYSYEKGDRSVITPRPPYGFRLQVIKSHEPLLINENFAERASQHDNPILTGACPKSVLFVPLMVDGTVRSILSIQDLERENAFSDSDVRLLQTLTNSMGIALENARLFDEIKRQEHYAQESQRRLADIIDFLPDATLVIDHEGRIIAWNHAIEEMTGYTAQEMIGRGNYEYALPFYGERRPILIDLVSLPREDLRHKYAHLQWDGGILTGEAHAPSLKGEARYLYATASALHDAQGNVVGAIETIRDITDRKHSEEELVKARASAEQANHAKSAFLANMSHELRTPLNAIIGFTRIVRRKSEGVLPEKQTENLDKVLTSAEHLLNLINTVLDIAKIEAGRMDVIPANFRVGALIDLCANTAQPLLRPSVILEKQVDESLGIVHSDQDKIRQIVLNLLSNAAKFTHEGCITLSAQKDGDNLRIAVCDTGIGISDTALPRIFKEFQQADSSTTRQYGGTGLGLSISRNLARLLGGDLNVESELGKGSTFTLVIPIQYHGKSLSPEVTPASRADRESVAVQQSESRPDYGAAKKRLLVIDDDPDAVYLLQENLDQQEFEVVGSRDGQGGLRLAQEQHPQAILLDIIMPGADGWQILNALKEDPATADIPVILLTIVDKKALGFRLGAAAYLLKPLDPIAVKDALHRVIKSERAQKHVLVVDDDPTVADMLRQFLPESEFRLHSAVDGVAGLQAIEAERPDVLLLDLVMPRLDGFGVIERLRANPPTRDLPIIVISAKELTADETARLRETVSLVMKKQGFEGDKLAEEINDAMRHGHRLAVSQA